MNEDLQMGILKAAALGFAQSAYNNGANDQEVAELVSQYVGENGTLAKRAARQELIMGLVAQRLNEIGALN